MKSAGSLRLSQVHYGLYDFHLAISLLYPVYTVTQKMPLSQDYLEITARLNFGNAL